VTTVEVLALQGDVPEHQAELGRIVGAENVRLVRTPRDLARVHALTIPGGESTAIAKMIDQGELRAPLRERIERGLPVLATCAGLILVAQRLEPSPGGRDPVPLGMLDVSVRRNDYGRQRESFEAPVRVDGIPGEEFPGVFIRAPRILEVGKTARAFAWRGDEIVGARSGPVWGLTFHPELSGDDRLVRAFLQSTVATG
jgi:5'-phosphate synthase pdxT subunit